MAETGSDNDWDQNSIQEAARTCNVSQMRRALAIAGVSPNVMRDGQPLIVILSSEHHPNQRVGTDLEARLACLDLLRQELDFDVNLPDRAGDRAIHYLACHAKSRDDVEFMQAVVDAGADVNATGQHSRTAMHWSSGHGGPIGATKVDLLIRAGASVTAIDVFGDTPLSLAISEAEGCLGRDLAAIRRVYPVLLAAGAALPAEASDPYLQRVIAAGSFANYARLHLDRLTAMLTPKPVPADGPRRSRRRLSPLRRVPPEVLRRIVAFAFHVGYY